MILEASDEPRRGRRLWTRLAIGLPWLVVGVLLGLALTTTYLRNVSGLWPWLAAVRAEIRGACELPEAQGITVGLVALYLLGFAGLRWLQVRAQADQVRVRTRLALVLALAGWALVSYALSYDTAAGSTDLLVLLVALAAGQGIAVGLGWEGATGQTRFGLRLALLRLLAVLLALGSMAHPAASREFHYRGQTRWVGLWDNPNLFGVLMAVGLVLNLGLLLHAWSGRRAARRGPDRITPWSGRGAAVLWFLGSVAAGTGLLFSYSRGAWLGAIIGVGWLGWRCLRSATGPPSPVRPRLLLFRRCMPAFALLALALGVIGFWSLRHTELPLLRRVFTVGNPNDFSWRNRVATWPGALEVMARQPLTGWGWNRPVSAYDHGHRPVWLSESAALTLNDYFMIGMTLGVPALWAFLLWLWLAWRPPLATAPPSSLNFQLSTSLLPRAALCPLLLAFALDGGLFKLAVAVPFCVLLELAANSAPPDATPSPVPR